MASYDASTLTNKSKRSSRIFSDLNLDFLQNTATKDIQKIEDVDAVKRSVRNLINTNHYEKPFHPEIGSNLRAMLFELFSPQMNHAISKEIDLLIRNYEPRCRLVNVATIPDAERNRYQVSISFYVVNHPEPIIVETFLERIR
jgi:phage baseplate assembly protein W|tara:strand:+ start:33 stop:461 length:429 start_codon:yes stop_codon:yes gene_type:complete